MPRTNISFVLPMYNEANTIGDTIKKVTSIAKELASDYEIIIADDGSTDGSGKIADIAATKDQNLKVTHLKRNTKFGGALRAGIKLASKDIILYTDSDLPIDALDIKGAFSALDSADIVTAFSRVKKGETLRRIIISKVYNFLIQSFFRTNIKDINSGFKIYKRKVFEGMELISESPFIDVEIFIRAKRKGCTIKQYPVSAHSGKTTRSTSSF